MSGRAEGVLQGSDEEFWLSIGEQTAAAYALHEKWLFRRVETIELIGRRSAKRSISVDFEVPEGLPSLGRRAAEGTKLVPISVYSKWPPLMDFNFVGPTGHPTSLYLRTTNKKLDFGLLRGMAHKALSVHLEEPDAGGEVGGDPAGRPGSRDCERLPPRLESQLKAIVEHRQPSQDAVLRATNQLRAELKKKLARPLERELMEGGEDLLTQIGATVDLAGRLASASVLWVAVTGTPGTDRIVKFSYCDSLTGESNLWRKAAIACSWSERILEIPLPHAGRYVRFHVDVSALPGGIELAGVTANALPPAADHRADDEVEVTTVGELAAKYPEQMEVPDERIGPASARFYLGYGKPEILASSAAPGDAEHPTGDAQDSSAKVVDGRAHVYLGAETAPSHRVWLLVKLAAPRDGFVKGCMLTACVVAPLMIAGYFGLSSAADHLEASAVLLSIVPIVLGYVLVRPGEQALERYHITGVRALAMLAGAMPIIGAFALVFTHTHAHGQPPDTHVVKPIWFGLTIFSITLASLLFVSWRKAAPSR